MQDYIPGDTLLERAMSGFPVSIGTSLALESLFSPAQEPYDSKREIPQQINVGDYQSFFVNLTTLFRNMSSAVSKEAFLAAKTGLLVSTLEEEIEVIENLFQNEGSGLCKPIFYYSSYEDLHRLHVAGFSLREPGSEAQKFYHAQLDNVLRMLDKKSDKIRHFKDAIYQNEYENTLVLTHQPYDLTNFRKFNRLHLLESNTGVLKPRNLWNSKYYPIPGEAMNHLPFHRKLLLVFGDRMLIKPMPIKFRKEILEVSHKRGWVPTTTLEKVKLDLDLSIKDPLSISTLKAL